MLRKQCFLTLMLVSTLYGVTSAIMCYECNSQYDPRCGDNFDPYSLALVNCSMKEPPNHLRDLEPILCRKITQKVFGKIRVIRGCGYIRDEIQTEAEKEKEKEKDDDKQKCRKRSGTFEVQSLFCNCDTDECNAAPWSTDIPTKHMILVTALLPSMLIKLIFKFTLQKSS